MFRSIAFGIFPVLCRRMHSCFLVATLLISGCVLAESLTLAELASLLDRDNPQIEQLKQAQKAAEAVVPQVLAYDNPQVGFIQNPITSSPLRLGSSQGFSYTLTQPLSFPGKKQLAADIAQDQADVVGTQVDTLKQQLLAQLKSNFWQLLALQRQARINEDNLARLEQIKQISKIQYANNAAVYVDYLNAQVAQSSAQNDLFALRRQIDNTVQTLNQIIGRNPGKPLEVRGEIPALGETPAQVDNYIELALQNNPQLKGSALQIRAAEKGMQYAEKSYMPNFQIVATKISNNPPWGFGGNQYGIEFDVILPSWGFTKEKAGVDQARANLIANRANEQATRQQLLLSLTSTHNLLLQSRDQARFIRTRQLEQAQTAWRLARQNYSTNGGKGFTELLLAQANLRSTELALLQAEASAAQAWGALEAAVGIELEQSR